MDLVDQLRLLSSRAPQLAAITKTEEAAKQALVLPFLQALGYNAEKQEEKVALNDVHDLFQYTDRLKSTVGYYAR